MNYIQNKTAIVTGASSGSGAATFRALLDNKVNVVAVAENSEKLKKFVEPLKSNGHKISAFVADVTDLEAMKSMVDFTKSTYGSVDILVNNAGLMLFSYWEDVAVTDWNSMIDVNIKGYLNGIAATLPTMMQQKSGQILNMA